MPKKERPSIQGKNHYKYKRMHEDVKSLALCLEKEELTVRQIEQKFSVQRSTVYKWLSLIDQSALYNLVPSFGTPRSFRII